MAEDGSFIIVFQKKKLHGKADRSQHRPGQKEQKIGTTLSMNGEARYKRAEKPGVF